MASVVKEKLFLSESTNGRGIKVVATATPGTTIHTAVAGTAKMDEVYIWAFNTHTADVILTVEFGGVTAPDDLIEVTLETGSVGLYLVIPGLPLNNTLSIRAFADQANVVMLFGYVLRAE